MRSSAGGDKIIESGGNRWSVVVADKVLRGGGWRRREMEKKQCGGGEWSHGRREWDREIEKQGNKCPRSHNSSRDTL